MLAEEFAGFGRGDAGVGGEAVEVIEAVAGRPRGQGGLAKLGEMFLEAFEDFASAGIAWGDGAAGAGMAAFKIYFADFEADDAAFFLAEELIFPEGGDAVDFERGPKAFADFIHADAGKALGRRRKPFGSQGKPFVPQGKPLGHSLQRSGGDNRGAAGDGFVGEAVLGVADDDLLLEEDAEPFGGVFVAAGEVEGAGGNFAAITGDGERDAAEIRGIIGADEMDGGSALAVDPFAVDRIEGPGAVEFEAAGGGDAGFGDIDRIQRFDGMKADIDQDRGRLRKGHGKSLRGGEVKKQ